MAAGTAGISPDDLKHISNLRSRFPQGIPEEYDDDFTMLHWLTAWNYNVDAIVPRLERTLEFRRTLDLDKVPKDPAVDFNAWLLSNFVRTAVEWYPGGVAGKDLEGNIIAIEPMGRADPRGLIPCGRCSEFLRCRLAETERLWQLIKAQERVLKRKCGVVYVMDMEGLCMDQIWMPSMQIYMHLITLLQDHYPDMLQKLLVIKAPAIMNVAYRMVYPILSTQTRQKIQITSGEEWRSVLTGLAQPDQLPVFWGGTQQGDNGSPYGRIRMAGKVPPELRYDPKSNPEFEPSPTDISEVSVGRNGQFKVAVEVPHTQMAVQWYMRVRSGDIYFSIYRNTKSAEEFEVVMPKLRLNTEYAPEYGRIVCDTPGTYTFEFDNSHSRLLSKTVQYCITAVNV